jgi:LacI family transcriptional regulator
MAVNHLAGLGHRRIAHIAGPQDLSTGRSRYQGFISAMAASGLPVDPGLVVFAERFTLEEGQRCCRELLELPEPCTAVAAGNDMLALGCYAALDAAGLGCPRDLSVVGFNDMPFIDLLKPPLTTVRFPHYQVGTEAAQLLLERIGGLGGPVKILYLAPEFINRGSTARVASQA